MKSVLLMCLIMAAAGQAMSSDSCTCHFARKDYDPAKGYYYDKRTWTPLPHITYNMECIYVCTDKDNKPWEVSYVHFETHRAYAKGGPTVAKKFVCDYAIKKFIPQKDLMGRVQYYDVELQGDFDSKWMNNRASFKEWNEKSGCH